MGLWGNPGAGLLDGNWVFYWKIGTFFCVWRMIKQKTKNRLPRGAGREKEGRNSMKVVVFRSTGFLSGILRMIFGIKKEQE